MPSIIVCGIYYHDHLSTTRLYPAQLAVVCNSHNTRKFRYYYYAIGAPSLISVITFWASEEIQGGVFLDNKEIQWGQFGASQEINFGQVRILRWVILEVGRIMGVI